MNPGAPKIPASAQRRRRQPQRGGGAVRRPASPDNDNGPYLKDGSVIPMSRTSIPIPVEKLLLDIDTLARSLDTDDLRTVVDELGKAFNGTGDGLGRLIDSGNLLLARAEQSLPADPEADHRRRRPCSTTQIANRSAIQSWAAEPAPGHRHARADGPRPAQLVVNAPDAGAAIQQLVQNAGPGSGSLVRNLDILNGVTIPRIPGIEQLLVTYPDVVSGGFSVVRNDGGVHAGALRVRRLNNSDPRACTTGYVSTGSTPTPGVGGLAEHQRDPLRRRQRCGPEPRRRRDESGSDIRGAQNIGGSGGSRQPSGRAPAAAPATGPRCCTTVVDQVLGGVLERQPVRPALG